MNAGVRHGEFLRADRRATSISKSFPKAIDVEDGCRVQLRIERTACFGDLPAKVFGALSQRGLAKEDSYGIRWD